jgi:WD40 repeat protein
MPQTHPQQIGKHTRQYDRAKRGDFAPKSQVVVDLDFVPILSPKSFHGSVPFSFYFLLNISFSIHIIISMATFGTVGLGGGGLGGVGGLAATSPANNNLPNNPNNKLASIGPTDCNVPQGGGNDGVSSITWSPTANILVSSNWDSGIRCWEVQEQNGQVRANPKAQGTIYDVVVRVRRLSFYLKCLYGVVYTLCFLVSVSNAPSSILVARRKKMRPRFLTLIMFFFFSSAPKKNTLTPHSQSRQQHARLEYLLFSRRFHRLFLRCRQGRAHVATRW